MTVDDALVDRAAGIVYDELHKDGYSNTWTDANDKTSYPRAIMRLLKELQL